MIYISIIILKMPPCCPRLTYPRLKGSPQPAATLAVGRHERADGGRPAVRVLLELYVRDDDVGLEDGPAVGADGVGPAGVDVDVRRAAVLAFLGGGHGALRAVNRRLAYAWISGGESLISGNKKWGC